MDGTKKERKYTVYNALEIAFRKSKISNSGSVARVLLECFLEDGGRLQASKVVARGICEEGKFSVWRDELVKNNWLVWSLNQIDKGHYHAGKKLLPYINKEKLASREIVTRSDILPKHEIASKIELMNTQKELDAVKERLAKVEEAIERGIDGFLDENPPKTAERRKLAKENFETTGKIFIN